MFARGDKMIYCFVCKKECDKHYIDVSEIDKQKSYPLLFFHATFCSFNCLKQYTKRFDDSRLNDALEKLEQIDYEGD